ncbi:DUF3782 domain-containing protein [Deltaproteobacteria bacterium TL4]
MTDQELKELVASLAIAQKETDRQLKETSREMKEKTAETDRQLKETDQQLKETSREMKEKTAETDRQLKEKFTETDRQLKETSREMKEKTAETDRQLKETDQQLKEKFEKTDRIVKELSKNIGGLNNKFGTFTEGMAFPSISKIMTERFGMDTFLTRLRKRKEGKNMEVDAVAYANGTVNELYVIEVKSRLEQRDLDQTLEILKNFRMFFPEFSDKTIRGMVVYVDTESSVREDVLQSGLYLASIHDEVFSLETPANFAPKTF